MFGIAIEATPYASIPALVIYSVADTKFGGTRGPLVCALVVLSLLLHELGHIAGAKFLGVRVSSLGFNFSGTYIRRAPAPSPWAEMAIAGSGPIVSLLLGSACYLAFYRAQGQIWEWLAQANIVIGFFNLLPIPGADGLRMLTSFLHGLSRLVRAAHS